MENIALRKHQSRYEPADPSLRQHGLPETTPLAFHSPYGCSKGCVDQYVLDYARTYGIRGAVFRMSCIYGPHQFGTEDQGWVAHFVIRALRNETITLYGDGCQVRDVLFVDDLVDAFMRAREGMELISGHAFNIGGGPDRAVSLLELLDLLRTIHGGLPQIAHGRWRTGDQRYYISDVRKFSEITGWTPRYSVGEGVRRLYRWVAESMDGAGKRSGSPATRHEANPSPVMEAIP
jgi:CDP-paratose 2-epimerase